MQNPYAEAWKRLAEALKERTSWGRNDLLDRMKMILLETMTQAYDEAMSSKSPGILDTSVKD